MVGFRIHKEGFRIISVIFVLLAGLNVIFFSVHVMFLLKWLFLCASLLVFCWVISFFRSPRRHLVPDKKLIYAPADGKIVAVEKITDNEFFHKPMLQVSVFMSMYDVHINWYPVSGTVRFVKYKPGKHLVAFHPKSSELNERFSVVIKQHDDREIMIRQIAGAVARRIVTYAREGQEIRQGDELGFIKFGSRVDLILPVDTSVRVHLGQKVYGKRTIIATFN